MEKSPSMLSENFQNENDSRNRLKELKDKIKSIDVCIKDSSAKINAFKYNPDLIKTPNHFFQESGSLLSTMNQKYELMTDPIARPVLETSMKIINEREKAAKAAHQTLDEIVKEVEKIKYEENEFLQKYIDSLIKVRFFSFGSCNHWPY